MHQFFYYYKSIGKVFLGERIRNLLRHCSDYKSLTNFGEKPLSPLRFAKLFSSKVFVRSLYLPHATTQHSPAEYICHSIFFEMKNV